MTWLPPVLSALPALAGFFKEKPKLDTGNSVTIYPPSPGPTPTGGGGLSNVASAAVTVAAVAGTGAAVAGTVASVAGTVASTVRVAESIRKAYVGRNDAELLASIRSSNCGGLDAMSLEAQIKKEKDVNGAIHRLESSSGPAKVYHDHFQRCFEKRSEILPPNQRA